MWERKLLSLNNWKSKGLVKEIYDVFNPNLII